MNNEPRIVILGARKDALMIARRLAANVTGPMLICDTMIPTRNEKIESFIAECEPVDLSPIHSVPFNIVWPKHMLQAQAEALEKVQQNLNQDRMNEIQKITSRLLHAGRATVTPIKDHFTMHTYTHYPRGDSYFAYRAAGPVPKSHLHQTLTFRSGKGAPSTKHLTAQCVVGNKPRIGRHKSKRKNKIKNRIPHTWKQGSPWSRKVGS